MNKTEEQSSILRIDPAQAWTFLNEHPEAVLVDVRSSIEFSHVGHPLGAVHIVWKKAPGWTLNPTFVQEVAEQVPDRTTPVLLLCRSGQRSLAAAQALAEAGYRTLVNIEEGFEGPLDENKHRGTRGGWRYRGLPWEQT